MEDSHQSEPDLYIKVYIYIFFYSSVECLKVN